MTLSLQQVMLKGFNVSHSVKMLPDVDGSIVTATAYLPVVAEEGEERFGF